MVEIFKTNVDNSQIVKLTLT